MLLNEAIRRDIFEKTVAQLGVDPKALKAWVVAADLDETVPHGNWILQALQRGMPFDEATRNRLNLLLKFLRQYKRSVVEAGFSTNVYDYKTYDDLRKMINSFRKNAYDFEPTDLPGVVELYNREPYAAYQVSDLNSLGKMGLGTKWCTRADWDKHGTNRKTYLSQGRGRVFIITKFNTPYVQLQPDLSQVKYWEDDKEYKKGDLGFIFKALTDSLDLQGDAVERLLKQLNAKDRNPIIKKFIIENNYNIFYMLKVLHSLPEALGLDETRFYEKVADFIRPMVNTASGVVHIIKEYMERLEPADQMKLAREIYRLLRPKMDLQELITKMGFCHMPVYDIGDNILNEVMQLVNTKIAGQDPPRMASTAYYSLKHLLQGKNHRGRWRHVEEYLLQQEDMQVLKLYMRHLLENKLRVEPLEALMLKIDNDPELLLAYAINCIEGRWQDAEHMFLGSDAVSKQMLDAYHELAGDVSEVTNDTPEIRALVEGYKKIRPSGLAHARPGLAYYNLDNYAKRLLNKASVVGPIPAFEQAMKELNDVALIAHYKKYVLMEPEDEIQ